MTTVELPRYQHVIDGLRVEAASGQRYDSVDPYLGAPWASAADGDAADVDLAPPQPMRPAAIATSPTSVTVLVRMVSCSNNSSPISTSR